MRRGFTLIEILVSLSITLMMMLAVTTLFQVMTESVSGSRALLETTDRLRACRNRLQLDLQGVTATMKPPLSPGDEQGYLEIGEGGNFDGSNGKTGNGATLFGDTDDYIAFTTRSRGEAFVGKLGAGYTEAATAEVIYFLAQSVDAAGNPNGTIIDATTTPQNRLFTLYRRALLVSPAAAGFAVTDDISQRAGGVANTLGDLTKPESRFNHAANPAGALLPFRMTIPIPQLTATRLGDDVILTNVLAFDVQVWDPTAPLLLTGNNIALEPRDVGYNNLLLALNALPTLPTPLALAFGAYVDLGYGYPTFNIALPAHGGKNLSVFSGYPNSMSSASTWQPSPAPGQWAKPFTYDTWSRHYESDGSLQNGQFGADAGANGLDDNGILGIDDTGTGVNTNGADDNGNSIPDDVTEFNGESDTMPPYSAPLRGVRITVRVYEPSSQQVREITVMQDF